MRVVTWHGWLTLTHVVPPRQYPSMAWQASCSVDRSGKSQNTMPRLDERETRRHIPAQCHEGTMRIWKRIGPSVGHSVNNPPIIRLDPWLQPQVDLPLVWPGAVFRALTHLPVADILRGCPLAPRWLISDSSTWSFTEAERETHRGARGCHTWSLSPPRTSGGFTGRIPGTFLRSRVHFGGGPGGGGG